MSLGIIATEQNAGFVKHYELCGEQKLLGKYKELSASNLQFILILSPNPFLCPKGGKFQ